MGEQTLSWAGTLGRHRYVTGQHREYGAQLEARGVGAGSIPARALQCWQDNAEKLRKQGLVKHSVCGRDTVTEVRRAAVRSERETHTEVRGREPFVRRERSPQSRRKRSQRKKGRVQMAWR